MGPVFCFLSSDCLYLGCLKCFFGALGWWLEGFESTSLAFLEVGLFPSGLEPGICFLFFGLLCCWFLAAIAVEFESFLLAMQHTQQYSVICRKKVFRGFLPRVILVLPVVAFKPLHIFGLKKKKPLPVRSNPTLVYGFIEKPNKNVNRIAKFEGLWHLDFFFVGIPFGGMGESWLNVLGVLHSGILCLTLKASPTPEIIIIIFWVINYFK